jgi:hypothetical protein
MNDLTQLYEDVFKSLPFSILGYFDFEDKKYEFYEKLANSNFIHYNSNLTLLFSAVLKIKPNILNNNNNFIENLLNWSLDKYDNFYFKAYTDGDKDKALSFYFWLLSGLKPTFVLSELIIKDIDFRIKLTMDKEPLIIYHKREDVLEASIPVNLFKIDSHQFESSSQIKQIFNHEFERLKCTKIVKKNIEKLKPRMFGVDVPTSCISNGKYKTLKNYFIEEDEENKIINKLIDKLKYFYGFQNEVISDDKNELYLNFSKCCIALSFLCYYYSSIMEYMLSIASLQYNENKIGFKERNLGGLIVCYKKDSTLSSEERVIFNLISDRLTSVIAGQYLYSENKKLRIENFRQSLKKTLIEFDKIFKDDTNVLHSTAEINKEHFEKLNEFITANTGFLAGNIFSGFITKLAELNVHENKKYINKYCISHLQPNKFGRINKFPYLDNSCFWENGTEFDFCNVPFISSIFSELTKEHNSTTAQIANSSFSDKTITFEINYKPFFDLESFRNKLLTQHPGSFIGTYLNKYYDMLLAHGNLIFIANQVELFNAYKDMDVIEGKIILSEEFINRSLNTYSKLIIKYIHHLS